MIRMRWTLAAVLLPLLAWLVLASCSKQPHAGEVLDEAKQVGRDGASFAHAGEDYFHDMDGALALTPEEVKGRNMWLVWSGGNDRFWTSMTDYTFGAFDLLKVVSSHPSLGYSRPNRWSYFGLVNEPCFDNASGPDKTRRGLWLDTRSKDCAADPFENETKYPGVAIGSRGKPLGDGTTQPVGSFYGYATGIVGLRLFPNPAFDEKAAKAWDPEKYYTDPAYYNRKDLVRPYRVGMSCGFCHVGPSPVNPPADPAHPKFANLSSSVGAQYMWVDRLFIYNSDKPEGRKNYMFQLAHTYRPGTMDTSLVSTDSINNPRSMNAVYDFGSRMGVAKRLWHEKLAGGELDNKQFNDFFTSGPLTEFYSKADATVRTPHVLKDGADSVGLIGALNRVYLNIGLFSEEWLLHFNPVVGGKAITPIKIATAQKNSGYWQATEAGTPLTALFFLKAAQPDRLKDAPGGNQYLNADAATLDRGKQVFADTCARCHSSKGVAPPAEVKLDPQTCAGAGYLDCFKRYWKWTQSDDYKAQMRKVVQAPDFLQGNYMSSEARIPVTLLRTNICSPLATNALAGNIWDNFSSQSYKQLPSVGTVTLSDPFSGEPMPYKMPAGGRGYTRVPSLISLWSTAPFLLNNTVGPFDTDPSVAARVKVFDASIEQMLWPQKRDRDSILGEKVPGTIDRTTQRSDVTIPVGFVPEAVQPLQSKLHRWLPWLVGEGGDIVLGPIPKDVPVGLLSNLKLRSESDELSEQAAHARDLGDFLLKLKVDLATAPAGASDKELRDKFANLKAPMMALSKCPDFVVNRGHYFGTAEFNKQDGLSADEKAFGSEPELSDDDKRALIAFLKTF
ncbi:MAG: cytochrome c [Betaproteobacteria bacterium]|nr:MAG: cytochrome c [Betaproteobacteria bacterium]